MNNILLVLLILICPFAAGAEISEPDNLLYGTLVIDSQIITATRTDIVIEARRTIDGPPIASYRMGSTPQVGDFYALRLNLEAAAPVANTNASEVGDSVYIIVRDSTGVRGQTTYTFPERGHVQQVDFGTPATDADGNGLPDAWEIAHFGSAGQNPNAIDLNGATTLANFTAGSDPDDTNSLFKLNITCSDGQKSVSFLARRAEGAGYDGRTRFYDLESAAGLNSGSWIGVAGFTNVLGNNQTITYQTSSTNPSVFYRARVSLQGP
jgi:hypothetical protein